MPLLPGKSFKNDWNGKMQKKIQYKCHHVTVSSWNTVELFIHNINIQTTLLKIEAGVKYFDFWKKKCWGLNPKRRLDLLSSLSFCSLPHPSVTTPLSVHHHQKSFAFQLGDGSAGSPMGEEVNSARFQRLILRKHPQEQGSWIAKFGQDGQKMAICGSKMVEMLFLWRLFSIWSFLHFILSSLETQYAFGQQGKTL